QVVDDLGDGWGFEWLRNLPGRSDKELLQHLNTYASLPGIPQFLDQGAGTAVLVPGSHVVGVDQDVRVDKLTVTAHAGRPATRQHARAYRDLLPREGGPGYALWPRHTRSPGPRFPGACGPEAA